jgi:hypothetical protein
MTKFNKPDVQTKLRTKSRQKRGSQIAELPPALLLLFFVFLFPLLNMFYLFGAFVAGWYLNSIELRQVACCLPSSLPPLSNPPDQAFHTVVLPQSQAWNGLFGVSEDINSPQVAQFPPVGAGANPNIVAVSKVITTVNIKPLVLMHNIGSLLPLGEIPGLGKPITFTYNGQIEQEEPGP